mmetsp:Transcript_19913/g.35832  ORF Transcript_19913/g.35832 Transcript_19913/m.35832 type:complete len:135 (+) Transcript_19913:57-461(+)
MSFQRRKSSLGSGPMYNIIDTDQKDQDVAQFPSYGAEIFTAQLVFIRKELSHGFHQPNVQLRIIIIAVASSKISKEIRFYKTPSSDVVSLKHHHHNKLSIDTCTQIHLCPPFEEINNSQQSPFPPTIRRLSHYY